MQPYTGGLKPMKKPDSLTLYDLKKTYDLKMKILNQNIIDYLIGLAIGSFLGLYAGVATLVLIYLIAFSGHHYLYARQTTP